MKIATSLSSALVNPLLAPPTAKPKLLTGLHPRIEPGRTGVSSSANRLQGGGDRPPKPAAFVGQNSLDRLGYVWDIANKFVVEKWSRLGR